MKNQLFLALLCCTASLAAQTTTEERLIDFKAVVIGNQVEFTPVMPPLMQIPGAPKAYYTYFWEFGDGSFSREENPVHAYQRAGDFTVSLDATAHYDNGKKPRKKGKSVNVKSSALASLGNNPGDVFDPKLKQMIAMNSYCKPRAEEEITLVLSYRNMGLVNTDGRIHLFFNEKKYPKAHFAFVEARRHYGELPDMSTSDVLPTESAEWMGWAALPLHGAGGSSLHWSDEAPNSTIIEQMLSEARGTYREEQAWRFNSLEATEKRNMFISLACTPDMLKDTNAMIHLEGVFAPFDPAVAPEKFVYEIEIVGSHDPNAIAVSDNRVSYRTLGNKNINYKIQFQNNGEGPANKVEVLVEIPKGLKMNKMKPLDWDPKCPICPKTPTEKGCLDTMSTPNGLLFTFRNIYLPGSRQKDVNHRDSTKGYVKYRIEADKNMPKLAFRSRAKIVFDKNPPIYTNYTRTRFKVGISPGLKVGYAIDPFFDENAGSATDGKSEISQNGYFFIGASLSPYKSWRLYPQVELLTGIKGRVVLQGGGITRDSMVRDSSMDVLSYRITESGQTSERGFISFEVPVLLRKNFSRFLGLGIGVSTRVVLESGVDRTVSKVTDFVDIKGQPLQSNVVFNESSEKPFKNTRYQFAPFLDLTLGSVRIGPNLGIRGGWIMGEEVKPFVQLALELKL